MNYLINLRLKMAHNIVLPEFRQSEGLIRLHLSYKKEPIAKGSAIRNIKEALGYESLRTPLVYTLVALDSIPKSRLDPLQI